ncbi:MAG: hypothetical protein BWY26_00003 [Elusimicrobia bacterium ADurb.Bin231]|nr:MAG: hypothetical protein BWY26_00003 [Elusimicrobia bacterium ADurb.Bin231]
MKTNIQNYYRTVFFICVLCSFLLLAAYLVILRPAQKKCYSLEKKLEEKKQLYEIIVQMEQKHTMDNFKRELVKLRMGLDMYVIEPKRMPDLIFGISRMANEKKVESFDIRGIEVNKGASSSKSKYITEDYIDVSFVTGFPNFALILNSLERNEPLVFIDKFSMIRNDDTKPASGKVKMNLVVFVSKKSISSMAGISENIIKRTAELERISK